MSNAEEPRQRARRLAHIYREASEPDDLPAHQRAWLHYSDWCLRTGRQPQPVTSTVAHEYVEWLVADGTDRQAGEQALTAILDHHEAGSLDDRAERP